MIDVSPFHAAIIKEQCTVSGLSPAMVAAICAKESDFDADAMRYEPNYRWLHRVGEHAAKLCITFRTEEQLQSFSYGLMQLMGASARALSYQGPLTGLLDPRTGIKYGCMHLERLYGSFAKGKPRDQWSEEVVAAYNAGSPRRQKTAPKLWVNEAYVRQVEAFYRELLAKGWV